MHYAGLVDEAADLAVVLAAALEGRLLGGQLVLGAAIRRDDVLLQLMLGKQKNDSDGGRARNLLHLSVDAVATGNGKTESYQKGQQMAFLQMSITCLLYWRLCRTSV